MEMQWLSTLFIMLYWTIVYPLLVLIYWAFTLLYWIASPLIYLGDFTIQVGLIPLRFLAKLEVRQVLYELSQSLIYMCQILYIYFGVAIIVGLTTGLILHFLSTTSAHMLGLDIQAPEMDLKAKGHTAATYRASREKRKKLDKEVANAAKARLLTLDPLLREALHHSPGGLGSAPQSPNTPKRRDSLLSTTILEEVEDSDGDFGF
jgi:hypothetical protein